MLISSGGRRVSLMRCFREALTSIHCVGKILTVDCSRTAPAFHLADNAWVVPPCHDSSFLDAVLEIAKREKVRLIVPTIDPELPAFAKSRERFLSHGIAVSVADEQSIAIALDKLKTYRWLVDSGFPTVRTEMAEEVVENPTGWFLPVIAKPLGGSASEGVRLIANWGQLASAAQDRADLIVQELASGSEFTINTYVNAQGKCVTAVPHKRIQTRGGGSF